MKKVFTNSNDVIHLFSQRTQSEARCSNVFFKDDCIYSYGYHYKLGEFLNDKIIWINDSGYSKTTSKHIRELEWATRQYAQVFREKVDFERVASKIENNFKSLQNARKPEKYINEIESIWSSFVKQQQILIDAKVGTNLVVDKRMSSYRLLKKKVKDVLENGKSADYLQYRIDAAKERKAKERKAFREALSKFKKYEINSFRLGKKDYLRLSLDGESIETNQGISVSIKSAKLLYAMIKANKSVLGHVIDGYTVTSINGTLKIGCHNIDMESVHEIGSKL